MKRILCILFVFCILLAGCSGKETLTIGGEQTTGLPALAQSEAWTAEALRERLNGLTQEEMHGLWGEPDGSCSGMWCDIWETENGRGIAVYYDADGCVEQVNFFTEDGDTAAPETEITEELMQTEQKAAWGITLTVQDVTAKGLTIVCTQSGGEPAGELHTGSFYTVQRLEDGEWKKVEYTTIDEEQVGWTSEAWIIPMESTVEWEVDWSWLYNELPSGQYRIGKSFMDWRAPGDYDEIMLYAEFTIE